MLIKYVYFSIILFFLIPNSSAKLNYYKPNNTFVVLSNCASRIVANLIRELPRKVIDVTTFNLEYSTVIKSLHNIEGVRVVTRSLLLQPNKTVYNEVCLIICNDFTDLKIGIQRSRKDSLWNPAANFVIILTKDIDDDIHNIFHFLMDKFLFNSTVIAKFSLDTEYYVFSCTPDWTEVCVGSKIGTINILTSCNDLNESSVVFENNYPTKFNGCRIKLITHLYSPFIIRTHGKGRRYRGIDEFLLTLLSEMEGFKFVLEDSGKVEDFGRVLDNYSYTGMLKYIEDDSSIVGACGGHILTWRRTRGLDFLTPYISDQMSLVIPRAPIFGTWSAVASELSYTTSIIIITLFILFCIMVIRFSVFINSMKDKTRDVLFIWGLFFSTVDVKYVRNNLSSRLIALTVYIFVILMYCVIQASLLRESTRPKRAYQMKEIEEVFESNYELILSPAMSEYLKSLTDVKISKISEGKEVCKSTLDCLMQVKNAKNMSLFTLSSDLYHKSFTWKLAEKDGSFKIYTIPRTFAFTWQTMYFHRGFPFLKSMNRNVNRILAGGHLLKYMRDMEFNERKKYHFHEAPRFFPITMSDFRDVFLILIFGWCFSFIIFICELKYINYRNTKLLKCIKKYSD